MLLAQEYVPDLSEYKDRFMRTPLGLLTQGNVSGAVDRLGADAMLRVDAMSNPESALQTGMDFMGGGLLGTTKLYHGTSPEAARRIMQEGFDVLKSADNTGWFTTNKAIGDNITTGKGAVLESSIDESKLKLAGWDEIDKYSVDELINRGYDGVKMTDNGETVYQMFYPEKMQYGLLQQPTYKNIDDYLKQTNKDTYPKIRTNKIFKNDVGIVPKDKRQQIDNIIKLGKESDLPTNIVSVNDLIPTQKNITVQNLSDVKNVSSSEPILAVEDNGKYFIIDGHHRLSNQILNGQNEVQIKVLK